MGSIGIGIAGLGTVGSEVARQLLKNKDFYKFKAGLNLELVALSAKNKTKDRGFDTSKFQWHATPIGIAALCKEKDPCLSEKFYTDAIKEGLAVGLDLSREERESHYSQKGLVILFYS